MAIIDGIDTGKKYTKEDLFGIEIGDDYKYLGINIKCNGLINQEIKKTK